MKKLILLALLFISTVSYGQTYNTTGAANLQRAATSKGYIYRNNMGTLGNVNWYTQHQIDSLFGLLPAPGLFLLKANNLSDVPNSATALANLNGASILGSYANPSWITSLAWSKITGTPTTLSGYGITDGITATTFNNTTGTTTQTQINGKQAALTAGANITISGNVISASGGGGSGGTTTYQLQQGYGIIPFGFNGSVLQNVIVDTMAIKSKASSLADYNVLMAGKLGLHATADNAGQLGGQSPSYYLNYNNLSNTPTSLPTPNSLTFGYGLTPTGSFNGGSTYTIKTDTSLIATKLGLNPAIGAYGNAHYIPLSQKGAANGVAGLDGSGNFASKTTDNLAEGATNKYWIQARTDALYPTKTGSGASGNWGINITGNAATADYPNIINDNALNSIVYPSWVQAGSGHYSIQTSTSKLNYVPFTGNLVSTSFEAQKEFILQQTSPSNPTAGLYINSDRLLHTYKPTGSLGGNLFIGLNSGNMTMTAMSPDSACCNTGVGDSTLMELIHGYVNTAVGFKSQMHARRANGNSSLGVFSLMDNQDGIHNSALGYGALQHIQGDAAFTYGLENVGVGFNAGNALISARQSIFLGPNSGSSSGQKVDCIDCMALGANTDVSSDYTFVYGDGLVQQHIFAGDLTFYGQRSTGVTGTGKFVYQDNAQMASPYLYGSPTVVTPTSNVNTTAIVNGAWVNSYFQKSGSYITGLTGDITGSGAGSITTTLKNTGTAGVYGQVTTDAQGRVTSGLAVTPISAGGTGSNTQNFVDLSTNQTVGGAKTLTGALIAGNAQSLNNVVGGTSLGLSGNGYPVLGYNINYTTTPNSYKYAFGDNSWAIDMGNSNLFRIRYGATGTGGSTISYTDFLTFNTSGNATFAGSLTATLPAYSGGINLPVVYNSTNNRFETGVSGGQSIIVASNDITSGTGTQAVVTYSNVNNTVLRIGAYMKVLTFTSGSDSMFVTYTDPDGLVQSQYFYIMGSTAYLYTSTGVYNFPPVDIHVKASTTVTINIGSGSGTYNAGGEIQIMR